VRRLLALVAAAGVAACSEGGSQQLGRARDSAPAAPRLVVEPAGFDFGEVLQERTLNKEFRIRNFGGSELRIDGVSTSCGCTAALPGTRSLAPGGSTTLRVSLETRDDQGPVERAVLLKSNDPAHPITQLKLTARVVAAGPRSVR
jgi:hypothetical protein